MEECTLDHIPPTLKTGGKTAIQSFDVGEKLFRRCTKEQLDNPYGTISLYDLSHNREGLKNNKMSNETDVLFSVNPTSDKATFDSLICTLEIKTLNEDNIFYQTLVDEVRGLCAKIILVHAPIPCMYPHTVFQIYANDIEVTKENYGATMGRKDYKDIRNRIRQTLGKMIVRRLIDQNSIV